MSDYRRDDIRKQTRFRTSRLFQDAGRWFFYTREGTVEGPYYDKEQAEKMLEAYVRTMSSCFAPPAELGLAKDDDLIASSL